jgi:hypothetical protein
MMAPEEEDRGIQMGPNDSVTEDLDNDGIVEDALGNPAAPEDGTAGD